MAWRIDEYLVRGEIDNRIKDRVTGTLVFEGIDHPIRLDLKGNPWRDLAGHRVIFTNPHPKSGLPDGFRAFQFGAAGDITASRKVRVPDCSMEEFMEAYRQRREVSFHMANSLHLEWYSEANGRVVIESADYALTIDGEAAWNMRPEDEAAQREANNRAIGSFMEQLGHAVAGTDLAELGDPTVNDAPTSPEEAEADAHDARMQILLDRVQARLDREADPGDPETFDRIMEEERERLRRERGEPEPAPLTPEQEAERDAWIQEANRAAQEALDDPATDFEPWQHPLVEHCSQLGIRLFHEIKERGWLHELDPAEHPLRELESSICCASGKLAGAMNKQTRDESWPPERMFAGDTLVRLKKARHYLHDALLALDVADENNLATPEWRSQVRIEVNAIMTAVEKAIRDVRDSLET